MQKNRPQILNILWINEYLDSAVKLEKYRDDQAQFQKKVTRFQFTMNDDPSEISSSSG